MSAQYCGTAYSDLLRSQSLRPRPTTSGQTTRYSSAMACARKSKSREQRVRPWTQTSTFGLAASPHST